MTSESQKRARDKYNAKRKAITLNFCPTEMDLYAHIKSQPAQQTYIKGLIRADMNKQSQKAP